MSLDIFGFEKGEPNMLWGMVSLITFVVGCTKTSDVMILVSGLFAIASAIRMGVIKTKD